MTGRPPSSPAKHLSVALILPALLAVYCRRACARAQAERERRRRAKEQRGMSGARSAHGRGHAMKRIWIAVAAAASAVIPLAACGSPAATTAVRPAAHASSAAARPAASVAPDPLQFMTTRQEKDVCTELRATVTVDRDAGMAFNFVPLEWQIAVQYKASGGSIAGAFDVLARATGFECPSLSWTLNDMQES